ncbi:MAG: OmpA family protein [Deltaproteobacteria bacterium]|nr:OmpA family protein [Deltaproteobacteria bacterium]
MRLKATRISSVAIVVLMAIWVLPAGADAQPGTLDFDLQPFHPAATTDGLLTIEGTGIGAHLMPRVAAQLGYLYQPLLYNAFGKETEGVGSRFGGTVALSMGLFNRLELGLALPVVFYQQGEVLAGAPAVKSAALGALRIMPKVRILGHAMGGFSLAASLGFSVPTAPKGALVGGGVSFEPAILAAYRRSRWVFNSSAGYRFRREERLFSLQVDDQLFMGVGVRYHLKKALSVLGEVTLATAADSPFSSSQTSPMLAMVGARYRVGNIGMTLAAGPGLVDGYGAAALRMMVMVDYTPGGVDSDGDGIADARDACPLKAEDRDGYADDDGCPEWDNDNDGVRDGNDKCPNRAEDKDGYQDKDGCPDVDNDGDGIVDARDRCPMQPEDQDGHADEDGCPDPDNDGDRILDGDDKCPNEAEIYNGIADADGCPEADRDGDGIFDDKDKCPDQPEDQNGIEDKDGCPDDPDGDRIPTSIDRCPRQPETYNKYQDKDGCPDQVKVKAALKEHVIWTSEAIYFTTNEWKIERRFWRILHKIARVVRRGDRRIKVVYVEGHTDQRGKERLNQWLSFVRARAVVRYLAGLGIPRKKLRALGRGMHRPLGDGKTDESWARDRRVRFHVVLKTPRAKRRKGQTQ